MEDARKEPIWQEVAGMRKRGGNRKRRAMMDGGGERGERR